MIFSLFCGVSALTPMLFVTNEMPYLRGILNSFSNSFFDIHSCEIVPLSDIRKNEAKASHL